MCSLFHVRTAIRLVAGWLLAWSAALACAGEPQPFVWIEGEEPASTNVQPNLSGWGRKHFLSQEKWLHLSIDPGKVDKEVPAEGAMLSYDFAIAQAGKYEVWNRIGFEFVRSPFEWRIDGGAWTPVGPDELTVDCMELDFWCEVAWLKLGERDLDAGSHTLAIRLPKTKDADGRTARILYASDALCLHRGAFSPHSRFKPDEDGHGPDYAEAARQVFVVPAPPSDATRVVVPLKGLWEICRHDEQLPGEVAEPIADFPDVPHWTAIEVPGDKNKLRPDLELAHRLWYRTRIRVPESCAGRSFYVVFPQNNLNTTVCVNGVECGFNKNPFARFQIDVTRGIQPGVNELCVGIKDAYYGYSANPDDPMKLRKTFNFPLSVTDRGFQRLAYPIWRHFQSGILVTPEFVVAGPAYVGDVFCKPSVARKELALEVTVSNTTGKAVAGELLCEAVNDKTKQVEKTFAPRSFTLAPGAEQTLDFAEPWTDPKLWWPDEPSLYRLRATVKVGGQVVDVSDATFGFREWSWDGRFFKLNGVVWRLWADCFTAESREEWLAFYRKNHERMMRFWGTTWKGMPPEEALGFFDRSGVIVRRSGILDGEAIGYMAIEEDPVLKERYQSPVKMDLMHNWRDQMVAQVKGERNHPSVMIWSIENEWLYINCINLHRRLMDQFEAEVKKVSDAVEAVDPTRPTMNDGGGAHKNQAMPVHGDHYVAGAYHRYPALAYETNPQGGGRDRWEWDEKRPRFIGEDFYITGNNPGLAYFGGEEAFQGKIATRPAASIIARMLMEGYRWAGQSAWHFWMGQNDAPGQYASYAPRAVFARQWNWSFGSGQKVRRTFGLFNDTRDDDPIVFTWTLTLDGQQTASHTGEHRLRGGTEEKFDVEIPMPTVDRRKEGELALVLSVNGREVFRDAKAVSVLPPARIHARLNAEQLLVFDPQGPAAAFLERHETPFTRLDDLDALPAPGRVLLVGSDALDEAESTSSRLAAYAAGGRRVIVLEQKHPLRYQAVPAEIEPTENEGTTAFPEDLGHPALRGLKPKDFFTWAPDEFVYRNAYRKPTRGAKSLIQCHELLGSTGLVEVPVGEGLLLLCQLLVGEKIEASPAARHLLANLVDYAAEYRLEFRPVAACPGADRPLADALDAIGLEYAKAGDPLEALGAEGAKIAIVSASPANLEALAGNLPQVKQFTGDGGWIVLHGLTPDGLADFNRLVGVEHMIRPFRRERVGFPQVKSPLTSGLTLSDVVLYSSERIFPWTQGNYVAGDMFGYVVDYEDVAPFAGFPAEQYENPDRNLSNMVNGMVSADAWKYIVNVGAPEEGPVDFTLPFPKEVELVEMEWTGNTFYYPVTHVQLIFDGKEAEAANFPTQPNNEPQAFPIDPPLRGTTLTLRLAEWLKVPGKKAVTGLDNVRLKARRSPEFYAKVKPLLSVGGMMAYPNGAGGIVLSNLRFQENEDVPVNAVKKRTILATVLRNLKAPFAGGRSIIAGADLLYEPIDLREHANQYRDERGWFGDKRFTLKDLPTGRQTLAGVPFEIYEFRTSPVPTVIMLAGDGVPNKLPGEVRGIPVDRKADALFFLHTARLDARRNPRELEKNAQYEMLRYVVTYADGQTADVPIYAEIDVDDYRQEHPRGLPGAQLAWTRPYPGTERHAAVYAKQWNNPRPDVPIRSLDVTYGEHRRGVPALIAVTVATAR